MPISLGGTGHRCRQTPQISKKPHARPTLWCAQSKKARRYISHVSPGEERWSRGLRRALLREQAVHGERAAPADHYGQRHGDGQEVIFNSLAFLIAGPVHEETELLVDHGDGCHHIAEDAEGGDASEESKDEAQPAEELRSEEHTSELQSRPHLVCRLLLEKKKNM